MILQAFQITIFQNVQINRNLERSNNDTSNICTTILVQVGY